MPSAQRDPSGMTLVELLVVVAIIGLLAVTVSPLFASRSERRLLGDAAAVVSAQLNEAIARSIGSPDGGGVWLQTESASPKPVLSMGVARRGQVISGTLTMGDVTATSTSAPITVPGGATLPAGGFIQLLGSPFVYRLRSPTELEFPPGSGYTPRNAAFPASSGTYAFQASGPPRQRMTSRVRGFRGDACIDLSASTIGVYGYTNSANVVRIGNTPPPPPTPPIFVMWYDKTETLAIMFDSVGRPSTAWVRKSTPSPILILPGGSGPPEWMSYPIDDSRPVALLVGQAFRIGLQRRPANQLTEDNPGPNIQSPDAFWVVIDPRAGIVRTIPNNPVLDANGTEEAAIQFAQRFVVEDLRHRSSQ
jgi:prepilin-type N-terminal cleavage/methylation domain-containing protein